MSHPQTPIEFLPTSRRSTPVGLLRISAGTVQIALSVWWVEYFNWFGHAGSSMVSDPHPTGEPNLGLAVAGGMAFVLAVLITLGAIPLLSGAGLTSSWNIFLGVLEIGFGVRTISSDWRSASWIIGNPPAWVDLLASGWVNATCGAAVVTMLLIARSHQRSRRPRRDNGLAAPTPGRAASPPT